MVINLRPRLYRIDADARTLQRADYRVGHRPVLVLLRLQVQESDVGPVVGEQQRQHRLGDLRVWGTGARERGKVFLIRSITVRTKLERMLLIRGRD